MITRQLQVVLMRKGDRGKEGGREGERGRERERKIEQKPSL